MAVLIDDLGFADIQPHGALSPTPHIGSLVAHGVQLENMHAYKYCSPSRRSLLSGRFPVHISGQQAPVCSNYLPLQMSLLPTKLKQAGFTTHFIGKGHLGYMTTDHLPINRGFDTHFGYLMGDQNYEHGLQVMCDVPQLANLPDATWHGRWPPQHPRDPCHLDLWAANSTAPPEALAALHYSTDTYAREAVSLLEAKDPGAPMFIYLAWQAVHGPWVLPDGPEARLLQPDDHGYDDYCSRHPLPLPDPNPQGMARTQVERCQFGSMLKVLDAAMANVTAALHATGLWDNTLMLVMSDNGGVGPGSNYPLRGQKTTPWQGGTRVAAFATGGFIPPSIRGARFGATLHFADVYPTLCNLVGVPPADTVVLDGVPRPIDGVDFWPLLLNSSTKAAAAAAAQPREDGVLQRLQGPGGVDGAGGAVPLLREYLPTTEDSIIWRGRWKLITSASLSTAYWTPAGGRGPNNTVIKASAKDWPCVNGSAPSGCAICSRAQPCLFDLEQDESERVNLAANGQQPNLVTQLARQLATYVPYVDGTMTADELRGYDCVAKGAKYPHPWWGNFTGPCCRPVRPMPAES